MVDADFLIFDEPTIHKEADDSAAFVRHISHAAAGAGERVINHRLEGLEDFDEILVLDEGRVVERSIHQYLVAAEGPYAQAFDSQRIDAPGSLRVNDSEHQGDRDG